MARSAKYAPLGRHLRESGQATVEMTLEEVGSLVGGLPESARKFSQWWENSGHHVQAKAWLAAGYRVASADRREGGSVRFQKA